MTVLVVGGGILGMVASFISAKRNKDVILVEAGPNLGGLLRGPQFEERYFDYGTHLLASTGIPEIDNYFFSDLPADEFNLFSGHESDLCGSFSIDGWNEETCFSDVHLQDFAASMVEWRRSGSQVADVQTADLELRSCYGQEAAPFFEDILRSVYGRDPKILAATAVRLLALHRAAFMSDEDIDSCQDYALFSPVIAHPSRDKFEMREAPDSRTIYPKKRGLGRVINHLEAKLKDAGVQILKNTKLQYSNNRFLAISPANEFFIDHSELIWTAGVPSAADLFLGKRFNGGASDMVCWIAHVELRKKLRHQSNYYYFIRHPNLRTYRVTNYSALTADQSNHAFTLELTVPTLLSEVDMADLVRSELVALGLIESYDDVSFLHLNRLNYSFLNATADFEQWCGEVVQELKGHMPIYGPWSSRNLFFIGDCLRDMYRRLFV